MTEVISLPKISLQPQFSDDPPLQPQFSDDPPLQPHVSDDPPLQPHVSDDPPLQPEISDADPLISDDDRKVGIETSCLNVLDGGTPQEERLIITHIENVNFKSYAGKKVLGPFHKSFSSIVGPNGSGKSNVIDAMLFVFGFRSKKIRSKKVSLLIHNSEGRQNIDSCSVTVFFERIIDLPGDDYETIPNSKFNVSRTARIDGSSDYYMNGKKQTFKEIGTILRTNGIDLDHNRFLILQGEVEQISQMKPKADNEHEDGMLEYLEDIIGSNRFKESIDNTAKEVEELNEKRGLNMNRLKAIEKERDGLLGAKDEAVEFLTMENNITKKNNILYQKYIYDCSSIESKSTEKRDEIKKELDALQEQLKTFIDQKKETGRKYKKINSKFDKLVEEAEEKKKAFADLEKYDLKIREELKHRKQNRKKLEKSLENEKKKLEEFMTVADKSKPEIEKCIKSLEQLEEQKEVEEKVLSEIMAGLKHETQGLQQEKEGKENELMEKQKVVNEAKSNLDVAKNELDIYLSTYKKLQEQYEKANENAENAKNTREEKLKLLASISEDFPVLKKELEKAEKDFEVVKKQDIDLSGKVKENRNKAELSRIAMQASQSRNAVIDSLMKEMDSGRLPGLYGRLGDLGGIDKKYDVAISTACGPLDFMVVDKIDTAQKGVEFLKHNNIGSTTFIALDKITQWSERANKSISTPENVKRLYDLVKVKDKSLKTAFYFALKDTLVADTLTQATRIAYPKDPKSTRWRVVTLNGELIETSGTMSGGGNKPAKGRMGCSVVEKVDHGELQKLQKDLDVDIEELQTLREKKVALEDTIRNLNKRINKIEPESVALKIEVESLITQEKEQLQRVKDLKVEVKNATPDENHKKKMQKDISGFEKMFKKADEAAKVFEKQVQDIHNKIMEIGKKRVGTQQGKVDSVNTIIDEVNQKKTKATVAIKTADRNIKKAHEKVEGVEKDIEENNTAIDKIEQNELKELEEKAQQCLNEAQEGQEMMKEAQIRLEEVKKAFESTDKEEGDMRSKEIDLKHEMQKYESTVKENMNKISHWKKKLSALTLHSIRQSLSISSQPVEELEKLTMEEVQEADDTSIAYEITVLTEKLAKLQPNMAAIQEYYEKDEVYLARAKELDDIINERNKKRDEHTDLCNQRLSEFMSAFQVITSKLKQMYQMITLGGDAELELVDSLDPFSEGVVFSVRPPKKSWKNISNLSGGEKTLSSLALVFALHHYKPSPLYVMDEIDAALDFKNVSIVGNYIKERTKNAQFIIISLRANMFELADRLVGIYKTDNSTKSVVIKNEF